MWESDFEQSPSLLSCSQCCTEDQTELKGIYDFRLTYSFGDAPGSDANAPPPMFTAIREQLGLKFEPMKTAVEVMVIDTIEQPSAN